MKWTRYHIELAVEALRGLGEVPDFSWEDFWRVDLSEVDLSNVNLKKAVLDQTDLEDADLEGANLEGVRLVDARLVGANLEGARLVDADIGRANLHSANLHRADLSGADATNASFVDANLQFASLKNTRLVGANLEGANLEGAEIEGAILRNTKLANACLRCVFPSSQIENATGIATLAIPGTEGAIHVVYHRDTHVIRYAGFYGTLSEFECKILEEEPQNAALLPIIKLVTEQLEKRSYRKPRLPKNFPPAIEPREKKRKNEKNNIRK